jgi:ElaB/YqjD/DUF883 family membrane-anchored ribosome-binding protein
MSATTNTDADLAAIGSDLSNLKGDVASLIEHFAGEVGSGVQGVSNQITDRVRCVSENAAANGKQTARAIGLWIERRPLLSLGIALGVGYVGARAFFRQGSPPLRAISSNSRPPRLIHSSTDVAPKSVKR